MSTIVLDTGAPISSNLSVPTTTHTRTPSQRRDVELPSCIIPGLLYLGSMFDAHNAEALDTCGVKIVINMAKEVRAAHRDRYHIRRYDLDDEATQSISHTFEEIFRVIDEAKEEGHAVLVHCMAGVSRSATVVIGYVMTRMNMSLKESFAYVRARRDVVSPNWGFVRQLQLYECKKFSLLESTYHIPGSAIATGNPINSILDGDDDVQANIN